jgi:hypothetical protein
VGAHRDREGMILGTRQLIYLAVFAILVIVILLLLGVI